MSVCPLPILKLFSIYIRMYSKLYPTSPKFYGTHQTKERLLHLVTLISSQLKQLNRGENVPRTRMVSNLAGNARKDLIFEIYLNLISFYKTSDRMVSIEGSQTNLKCLLVSAKMLSSFFLDVFTKIPTTHIESGFDEFYISHSFTQEDVAITSTWRMISQAAIGHHEHHLEVKRACQEQKAFRESFLKTQTDFDIDFENAEAEQETQLLSIEYAVLIIQKLERKYQAISRRNYVRFVRERAAELHGLKVEIDATQAAIRIQARTRGYFARKLVREMREKELNILNMTPESYIRKRCAERERKRKEGLAGGVGGGEIIEQIEEFNTDLAEALKLLKTHFFFPTSDLTDIKPSALPIDLNNQETIFRDACFRGIVSPLAQIELSELTSQREICKIENRQFKFDFRSFLVQTVCTPCSLGTWQKQKSKDQKMQWLLLSGAPDSGKTTWARAISRACHVTHVHISKNVVNMGKRKIYTVVKKLAKQEKRLLVSIDRIDVMKKDPKHKGYTHRQILLRNFLSDLSNIKFVMVIGMTRVPLDDLDSYISDLFPLQATLSNPTNATRYDLAVDCLSRNWEQERLPKFPNRIFDIEKQTKDQTRGKAAKFVTNRWSAANNKTTLS
ncbi:ATPase AAA-type core domain-containing protein [Caenorhabditis elegans]|uniref:ATPase AAA-type core domain-containing protein n=1 Tax=Caenorhabditis elegans TaxID=6239 RepID=Q23673_CAEEL|nr:ATPase AAA-type core domain-containing protein [Caenorhabditis elegans]CAA90143.2 ATPase AAA-type core domain-containing protein [Caenorhabditis elegans]